MIYNVITPLSRYQNLRELIGMLEPQKVRWHVITDEDCPFRVQFEQMWIHHYVCPNHANAFWDRCNSAINWFLERAYIHLNERYCFLNDDDAYEPDFFKKIDAHSGDVVVSSMLRGHQTPAGVIPERAHAPSTLVAAPENMHPGAVGVEQVFFSGRLALGLQLPIHIMGDGMMVEKLVAENKTEYAPEANVWFNYYEPGRWNK